MIRKPTKEETSDIKTDNGSAMRVKSRPSTRAFLKTSCPPPRAKGIRNQGSTAVTPPRTMAQADRADREIRPALGIVKDPTTGIKTVKRTSVSVFMRQKSI